MKKELTAKPATPKPFVQPWGWSKLEQYRTCPQKFHYLNVQKLKEPESLALVNGSKVHDQLEQYVNGWSQELPPGMSPFWKARLDELKLQSPFSEAAWGVDRDWLPLNNWLHPSTWLRAKSDVYRIDLDENTLILIDYKTGKYRVPSDDQIELYAIVGHCFFPKVKKVVASFWFVDQDAEPLELDYKAAELVKLRRKFTLESAKLYNEKQFAPKPGSHCRYCHFSRQKNGPCKY